MMLASCSLEFTVESWELEEREREAVGPGVEHSWNPERGLRRSARAGDLLPFWGREVASTDHYFATSYPYLLLLLYWFQL